MGHGVKAFFQKPLVIDRVDLHEAIVTSGADGIGVKVGFNLCDGKGQSIGHLIVLTAVLHDFLEFVAEEPPLTHDVITVAGRLRGFLWWCRGLHGALFRGWRGDGFRRHHRLRGLDLIVRLAGTASAGIAKGKHSGKDGQNGHDDHGVAPPGHAALAAPPGIPAGIGLTGGHGAHLNRSCGG